ncbi:hypothetical protein FIBSPDRAFT_753191, partial [Athelia psychrophila]
GNWGSNESREQTIANASRKIQSLASAITRLAATRLYTLAVEYKFTKGRKSHNVVAVCLYVACRQKETRNYMLIDFSDLLQVRRDTFSPPPLPSTSLMVAIPPISTSACPWSIHRTTYPASLRSSSSARRPKRYPPIPCALSSVLTATG